MRFPHRTISIFYKTSRSATYALFLVLALMSLANLSSCRSVQKNSLVVWTYDSFVSEWGPAAKLAEMFAKNTGLTVEFVSKGDGGALFAALLASGRKAEADLVIGLDDRLAPEALKSGLFIPLALKNSPKLDEKLKVDPENRLVPYDYGDFAFILDTEAGINVPMSLEDLTKPEYKKKIIIMDPRTSTPGLGLLAWTQSVYGSDWKEYWRRLAPSILAMTPGWDTGYGLFTKGEAPLVLSYSTSPAYHKAYENSERYRTLVFKEGHSAQIELAGVLGASKSRKNAEKFLDFLISEEAQAILPETQWMYPANKETPLPASFSVVPEGIRSLRMKLGDPVSDPETATYILSETAR